MEQSAGTFFLPKSTLTSRENNCRPPTFPEGSRQLERFLAENHALEHRMGLNLDLPTQVLPKGPA